MASTRLQHLRTAAGSRLPGLRGIKYDLTGHLSRKVEYIQNGLIPLLATVLADIDSCPSNACDDELTYAQVAQVLCVIAHGRVLLRPYQLCVMLIVGIRRSVLCPAAAGIGCFAKTDFYPPDTSLLQNCPGHLEMPKCCCRQSSPLQHWAMAAGSKAGRFVVFENLHLVFWKHHWKRWQYGGLSAGL